MAERKSFLLRIDQKLYEDIKRWADAELRSVNAQIEWILRRAAERRAERLADEEDDADDDDDRKPYASMYLVTSRAFDWVGDTA